MFIISCGDIDFVYKEDKNLINPLYGKTEVSTSGIEMNYMNSYLPMFFGNKKDGPFSLSIKIEENKIKNGLRWAGGHFHFFCSSPRFDSFFDLPPL